MALIDLNKTLGVFYVCVTISAILFGASCLQLFLLYQRFPQDSLIQKTAVAFITLLDGLILVFCMHGTYFYLILNYGNPIALAGPPIWSMKVESALADVMIPLVQTMYCLRIWKLSGKNKIIPIISTIVVLAVWGTAILDAVKVCNMRDGDFKSIRDGVLAPASACAGADLVLALSLIYYIRQSKGHFSKMNSILNRLILMILGTGLLTTTVGVACLLAFVTMPDNFIFISLQVIMGKLYVNSYLSMLNARSSLRSRLDGTNRITLPTAASQDSNTIGRTSAPIMFAPTGSTNGADKEYDRYSMVDITSSKPDQDETV